ncbi:hypothetical protein [Mailhella massiliensis]|uniref:Uncharacterized protein n=1 Tax=Mailhella massiliensis TaxID=1903261 RepID=A0A921AY42_9BACT|nr:hypothetical protein [Mailhella massiliensis]HJD98214.1 hypothetical protein [Mailhella massiliensis]
MKGTPAHPAQSVRAEECLPERLGSLGAKGGILCRAARYACRRAVFGRFRFFFGTIMAAERIRHVFCEEGNGKDVQSIAAGRAATDVCPCRFSFRRTDAREAEKGARKDTAQRKGRFGLKSISEKEKA